MKSKSIASKVSDTAGSARAMSMEGKMLEENNRRDKETAPTIEQALTFIKSNTFPFGDLHSTAELMVKFAVECTAQAPTQVCRNCELDFHGHCVNIAAPGECACFLCLAVKATPQGTPKCPTCGSTIKNIYRRPCDTENRTADAWHSSAAECPQCGSKDFWTVLPACHRGKAHKWHSKEK